MARPEPDGVAAARRPRAQAVAAGSLTMLAGVDLPAERLTGNPQGCERGIFGREVRLGRDEVGLGDLDRALRAALARRIGWHAGVDRQAIVAAGRHENRGVDRGAPDPLQ